MQVPHAIGDGLDCDLANLARLARRARFSTVRTIYASGGGHYGGSLSVVDILVALFQHIRSFSARNAVADKIVLSKGHAAAGYYATMAEFELIDARLLDSFAQVGAALQGHPDMVTCGSVDFSTGSLGQGLSAALGMAICLREDDGRAWVVLGDGECQEGQIWEAAMLAARLRVGNLTVLVDQNGLQEWGYRGLGGSEEPVLDAASKWEAFGWTVLECSGHDHAALLSALRNSEGAVGRPTAILAKTVKGFGSDFIAARADRFHCDQLTPAELDLVLGQL
jgi:transketolase